VKEGNSKNEHYFITTNTINASASTTTPVTTKAVPAPTPYNYNYYQKLRRIIKLKDEDEVWEEKRKSVGKCRLWNLGKIRVIWSFLRTNSKMSIRNGNFVIVLFARKTNCYR
jgi:hypothetical protein